MGLFDSLVMRQSAKGKATMKSHLVLVALSAVVVTGCTSSFVTRDVKGEKMKVDLRDPVLSYTYIQYLVEPGRTLVFSFNCPRRIRADWQGTAHKVMKSIKID